MLRTQASDEEVDDVFSRRPLYYGRTGSDVIGCRRPTGGVFICMLHTRVTLTAFPIATPRGRSVSFPTRGTMVTCVTWDVPLHGNFELRPLGVAMGNVIPTPPCWGECKPISRKRRALSQLYQAKGVAPGMVDGCQWPYPLRPKTRAAYPKHLPARCQDYRTQGRAQSLGIRERFL